MATKFERVVDIFASAGLEVSDDLVASRFEARHGETVSAETIRKARKAMEEAGMSSDETPVDEAVVEDDLSSDDDPTDEPEAPEDETPDEDKARESEEPTADPGATEGAPEPEPKEPVVIDREPVEGRCNHRMEKALDLCGRPEGHPGVHTTVAQMEKKKAFSKARAMTRYHSDPEYAARVKEASRNSHKKARDEIKELKAKLAAMEAEKAQSADA